jgi:hypothetical protein
MLKYSLMLQIISGRIQNKNKISYTGKNIGLSINFAEGSQIFMTISDVLLLMKRQTDRYCRS